MEELFWIIWMWVLPVVAVFMVCFFPVWWWIIVPPIARKFTRGKFGNTTVVPIAHPEGYVEFEFTKKTLKEGVLEIGDKVFRFLPRPLERDVKEQGTPSPDKRLKIEKLQDTALRKYIIKDYGKPIVFGFAGKTGVANPEIVANLSGGIKTSNPNSYLSPIQEYAQNQLPKKHSDKISELLKEAHNKIANAPIPLINLDLETLKEYLYQFFTPSQIKAIAEKYYARGLASRDRDVVKIGLIIVGVLGLSILAIVLASRL